VNGLKMHRHHRRAAQNEQAARAAGEVAARLSQLKPEDLPPVHVAVYKGATKFVKHYPVTSFLYILGLGLMCFATGGGAAWRSEARARCAHVTRPRPRNGWARAAAVRAPATPLC
jgi:anti-sigma factor RsiW